MTVCAFTQVPSFPRGRPYPLSSAAVQKGKGRAGVWIYHQALQALAGDFLHTASAGNLRKQSYGNLLQYRSVPSGYPGFQYRQREAGRGFRYEYHAYYHDGYEHG